VFFGFDGFDGGGWRLSPVRPGLVLPSARPLGAISTGDAIGTGHAVVSSPKANAAALAGCVASLAVVAAGWFGWPQRRRCGEVLIGPNVVPMPSLRAGLPGRPRTGAQTEKTLSLAGEKAKKPC